MNNILSCLQLLKKYNVCVRSLMLTCTRVMHYSALNFTFIWLLDLIFLAKFLDNLRFFFIAKNYLFQINNSNVFKLHDFHVRISILQKPFNKGITCIRNRYNIWSSWSQCALTINKHEDKQFLSWRCSPLFQMFGTDILTGKWVARYLFVIRNSFNNLR